MKLLKLDMSLWCLFSILTFDVTLSGMLIEVCILLKTKSREEIYNIGVLTVNIECIWQGLETGDRRALVYYSAIKFAKNVIHFNNNNLKKKITEIPLIPQ